MPYFKFEKKHKGVPIEKTKCWSCARLRHRTNGNFFCPKNQLIPKILLEDFAAKCTGYTEDIKDRRNEFISFHPRKSIRAGDVTHVDNERQTVSRDEQIRVLSVKGLVGKYRGHVGTPQEIEKRKQEGFELVWEPAIDARAVQAPRKKPVVERHPKRWKVSESYFERPAKKLYYVGGQVKSVSIKEAEHSWTLDDRNIFSVSEMRIEGYCEECSNYGLLHYTDGLYLCENCRQLKSNLF